MTKPTLSRTLGSKQISPQLSGLWLMVIGLWLSPHAAFAQSEWRWSSEVAPLVQRWWQGEREAVQADATQLMRTSDVPRIRHEADAVSALCLLCSPVRSEITNGRSTIAGLADRYPALLQAAAVEYALAIGHTTLSETTAALTKLFELKKQLSKDGDQAQLAAVLTTLAEAWVVHNEWESTPVAGLAPDSPEKILAFRLRELNTLADRTVEWQLPQATRDAIAWAIIRARRDGSIETEYAVAARQLRELAEQPSLTPSVIAARWELIDQLTTARDWADAKAFLEGLSTVADETTSEQAKKRLAELAAPHLVLDAPDVARPGNEVAIDFEARNLEQVQLTLRRLDLSEWLNAQRGRFELSKLPVAGSLIREETFAVPVAKRALGWRPNGAEAALTVPATQGHYVLQAVGTHAGGEIETRRLIQVTNLRAHLMVGRQRGVLWLPEFEATEPGRLVFWMRDAFVPLRIPIASNVHDFDLPGEARVFRDKRWMALIEFGDETLLCQGHLPHGRTTTARERVLLTGSPVNLRVGEVFRLSGRVLGADPASEQQPLKLHFQNPAGKRFHSVEVTPDAQGAFSTEWTPPVEAADQPIRIQVLRGRVVVPPADEPFNFRPLAIEQAPLNIHHLGENWIKTLPRTFNTWQAARYSWNPSNALELHMNASLDFLVLPDGVRGLWSIALGPYGMHTHGRETLNEDAFPELPSASDHPLRSAVHQRVQVKLTEVGLTRPPVGVLYSSIAYGWDERPQRTTVPIMVAKDDNWHAWLAPAERHRVRAGEPLRLRLNWFDANGTTFPQEDRVTITSDGQKVAELPLYAESGAFATDPWIPAEPGSYNAQVVLSRGTNGSERVSLPLLVFPPDLKFQQAQQNVTALVDEWQEPPVVTVALESATDRPLMVMLLGTELSRARILAAGETRLEMPLSADRPRPSEAVVFASRGGDLIEVGRTPIRPQPAGAPHVVLESEPGPHLPGTTLPIQVSASDAGSILLQLTSRKALSALADRYGVVVSPKHAAVASLSFTGVNPDGTTIAAPAPTREELGAWSQGAVVWHQLVPIEANANVMLPLPHDAGLYDLHAQLITEQGTQASARQALAVDAPLKVWIDTPDRMLSGDRLAVAVWLTNTSNRPQNGTLRISADAGFTVEGETARPFTLASDGKKIFRWIVEGTTPGPAKLTAHVSVSDANWAQPRTFHVVEPTAPADPRLAFVSVRRSIVLLERDIPLDNALVESTNARWIEVMIPPDTPIPLGSRLLIRDEIVPNQPLTGLTWEQQFGGNLATIAVDLYELRGPAKSAQRPADRMTAPLDRLIQPEVFEYIVVATRPGVSSLPPPRLEQRGRLIPISLNPEVVLIRVTE